MSLSLLDSPRASRGVALAFVALAPACAGSARRVPAEPPLPLPGHPGSDTIFGDSDFPPDFPVDDHIRGCGCCDLIVGDPMGSAGDPEKGSDPCAE